MITIKKRHTGRYYVGLDEEAFCSLSTIVLVSQITISKADPDMLRVRAAFDKFLGKLAAEKKEAA